MLAVGLSAGLQPEQGRAGDRVRRSPLPFTRFRRRFAVTGSDSEPARRGDDSVAGFNCHRGAGLSAPRPAQTIPPNNINPRGFNAQACRRAWR